MRKCQHVMAVLGLFIVAWVITGNFQVARALEHANVLATASSAYWKDGAQLQEANSCELVIQPKDTVYKSLDTVHFANRGKVKQKHREVVHKRFKSFKIVQTSRVSVSAYNPTVKQCGPNPFITAKGTRVRHGIVAVSRDLYRKGWTFGKKIGIGQEVYIIEDLMAKNAKNGVDIFKWHEKDAVEFGRRTLTVALLN